MIYVGPTRKTIQVIQQKIEDGDVKIEYEGELHTLPFPPEYGQCGVVIGFQAVTRYPIVFLGKTICSGRTQP